MMHDRDRKTEPCSQDNLVIYTKVCIDGSSMLLILNRVSEETEKRKSVLVFLLSYCTPNPSSPSQQKRLCATLQLMHVLIHFSS